MPDSIFYLYFNFVAQKIDLILASIFNVALLSVLLSVNCLIFYDKNAIVRAKQNELTIGISMTAITIIHNPRCSKSRQTLALLEERGVSPVIVEYLKHPLSVEELKDIFKKLNVESVREMMRIKEDEYKTANLGDSKVTNEALFEAMSASPKLIERPIVINGDSARIGRPPESVLEIL